MRENQRRSNNSCISWVKCLHFHIVHEPVISLGTFFTRSSLDVIIGGGLPVLAELHDCQIASSSHCSLKLSLCTSRKLCKMEQAVTWADILPTLQTLHSG